MAQESRKMGSSCFGCSFSPSVKLLFFTIPLILVSGLFSSLSPKASENRVFFSYPFSSSSSSSYSKFSSSANGTAIAVIEGRVKAITEDPVSVSRAAESSIAVNRSSEDTVSLNRSSEDTVSVNRSSSPLIAQEVAPAREPAPVKNKEALKNITLDMSRALNDSHNVKLERVVTTGLDRLESELQRARAMIKKARHWNRSHDPDYVPTGPMYWNANLFHR
ncbi:hypothetical protein Nepgr_011727 [Nepenthes gracilis]|uniref:Uncharacterized protein n=1 Tax=Nepenthes gracilis TaxID=150966 RepID=A0AAD3XMM4_NEPGR|nr:hypothetical protein Nepgr_011727 [Nepenthes gracilis]